MDLLMYACLCYELKSLINELVNLCPHPTSAKPPLLPSGHTHQNFFMHDEHIRLCKKKEKKGIRFKVGSDENIPTVACF